MTVGLDVAEIGLIWTLLLLLSEYVLGTCSSPRVKSWELTTREWLVGGIIGILPPVLLLISHNLPVVLWLRVRRLEEGNLLLLLLLM